MNLQMGSQLFENVHIPLLWGSRAIVQDEQGRLSIIDLSDEPAFIEILADEPAPDVDFRPRVDGTVILRNNVELYSYNPQERTIRGIALRLPEVEITDRVTRVGTNEFSGNVISGFGVGIAVSEDGLALGAPLPPGLARLIV